MSNSSLTYLDHYCERAGSAEFWAEPLNAITNIAFLITAFYSAKMLYRLKGDVVKHLDIWALSILLAMIGIGSFLWHTAASPTTVLMDVIPILLFMNLYLISLLARVFHLKWCKVVFLWCVYFAGSMIAERFLPADLLNGSVLYAPTYLTLLLLMAAAWRIEADAFPDLFAAVRIFTLSLVFRTIDVETCTYFPIGTHFMWHCLNALLLYRLMKLLVQQAISNKARALP